MVIRKVFRYDKDGIASAFCELDRWLNVDDDDEEYCNSNRTSSLAAHLDVSFLHNQTANIPFILFPSGEGVNTDTTAFSSDYKDTPVDRKRKRTGAASGHKSEVWTHFTKIYNTDYVVVYVVCHTCDRGYTSGRSKNGTSHLRRHHESCASKR